MVEHAFRGGLTHKLHVARPYDDVANLLSDAHYHALAAVSVQPFPGVHAPVPGGELGLPATAGPGYDRGASLENIRENYEFIPERLNQTLPRALSDPGTAAGLQRLREGGWLDWHILVAIMNVALNIRAEAAGLLDRPLATQREQQALARTPETADSEPILHAALTPESLSHAMQVAMLAIARRRWRLLSPTQTSNLTAFRALLATSYGWNDDVPHRDLLSDVLTATESSGN